jgi:dihydrodipicolinate synthase/N-acetylneuraminate lyase
MASLLMPSFFARKMTAEVMERYVRGVADSSPLPVVPYNNPGVAAAPSGFAVLAGLSGSFGVPGVKAAMDLAGYRGGEPRHPHLGLKPPELE